MLRDMARKLWDKVVEATRWAAGEAWEKVNVVGTWRELRALGQKYGTRFFVAAVLWEIFEDVVCPYVSWRIGAAWLIPVFLIMHFEFLAYPVFFFCFRTYDRIRGREPWEPDRQGQSTVWRSVVQALAYRTVALPAFLLLLGGLGLPASVVAAYMIGMTGFYFVHDRLWHDYNFGIDVPTDTVRLSRVVAKASTYRAASALMVGCLLYGILGHVPWQGWAYQGLMFLFHVGYGLVWARSPFGIRPVDRRPA